MTRRLARSAFAAAAAIITAVLALLVASPAFAAAGTVDDPIVDWDPTAQSEGVLWGDLRYDVVALEMPNPWYVNTSPKKGEARQRLGTLTPGEIYRAGPAYGVFNGQVERPVEVSDGVRGWIFADAVAVVPAIDPGELSEWVQPRTEVEKKGLFGGGGTEAVSVEYRLAPARDAVPEGTLTRGETYPASMTHVEVDEGLLSDSSFIPVLVAEDQVGWVDPEHVFEVPEPADEEPADAEEEEATSSATDTSEPAAPVENSAPAEQQPAEPSSTSGGGIGGLFAKWGSLALAAASIILGIPSLIVCGRFANRASQHVMANNGQGWLVMVVGFLGFVLSPAAALLAGAIAPTSPAWLWVALAVTGLFAGFILADAVLAWGKRVVHGPDAFNAVTEHPVPVAAGAAAGGVAGAAAYFLVGFVQLPLIAVTVALGAAAVATFKGGAAPGRTADEYDGEENYEDLTEPYAELTGAER